MISSLLVLCFLFCLLPSAWSQINVCKFQKQTSTPSPLTGYFRCSVHAVNDRICTSQNEYYAKLSCETQTGGAVNILTEFGTKYLLLGDMYAEHYLTQQ